MRYRSTRPSDSIETVSFTEAMQRGQAPDGGLYWPCALPSVAFGRHDQTDPALIALSPFMADDALAPLLSTMIAESLSIPSPLVPFADDTGPSFLLELFHGPTAAFKDFGARFLASCHRHIKRDTHNPLTILVATSGDTGGAVAAAFHRREGVRVVILFPEGRVSPLQAHQLSCWGDNITTFAVQGTFDNCQALVKGAFADPALVARFGLTSANSINIGRLLPQMSYYVRAACTFQRTSTHADPIGFIVPTGNMGNVLAALMARAIGAPIGPIVIATNRNDTIGRYLETGVYDPPALAYATPANAMDVAAPSNLERARILFPTHDLCRSAMRAFAIDDSAIYQIMRHFHDRTGHIVCPHTACGLQALSMIRTHGDTRPYAVAATAHAAKFSDIVERALGPTYKPILPQSLEDLLTRPARAVTLAADPDALRLALQTI